MKSAIGIGALLMDGLGDTIRVSLTEDPEYEMDPCGRWAGWARGEGGCLAELKALGGMVCLVVRKTGWVGGLALLVGGRPGGWWAEAVRGHAE